MVPELTHPDGRRAPLLVCPGTFVGFCVRDSAVRPVPGAGAPLTSFGVPPAGSERKGRRSAQVIFATYPIA